MSSAPSSIPAEFVRAQLARVLESDLFAGSPRMARFLQFTVEQTLQGNAAHLKENVIGAHVFDRAVDYDPRIDPIVRVEARRLRGKLSAYSSRFAKPGDLIWELPKGGYVPRFLLATQDDRPSAAQPVAPNTVAVLPFVNLSAAAEPDFVSEGLTEDLISALTQVPELRVSAWASAARVQKDYDDLDAIRTLLNVTFVVRGSVRRTSDRIRILAHLVDTESRRYLWSHTFDRSVADIFILQDEITRAIVAALQANMTVASSTLSPLHAARDFQCQELCWKGRSHARERTMAGLERSAACFELATQTDPTCVSAFAGLAGTLTLQAEFGFTDVPSTMRKAKAAVDRALALNSQSFEAEASRALILTLYDRDWPGGEAAFRRAIALNASYAPAHHWYALNHLAMEGRFAEAEDHLQAAIRLDPLSSVLAEGHGFLAFLQRDYDRAISIYQEVLADEPGFHKAHASMARAYLQAGAPLRAVALIEQALTFTGELPTMLGVMGQAHGVAGNRREALGVLQRLREIAAAKPVPSTCFALVHAGMGDFALAMEWLERAVDRCESSVVSLAVHPAYDHLRGETRFQALTARVMAGSRLTVS